jgi:formate dehydrogenase iron-sulfur subunit
MSAKRNFSQDRTFLIDTTRCTGCRSCQVACKQWNQMKAEETTFFNGEGYQNPPNLSENTLTAIKFRDYWKYGKNEFAFYKEMCMHCNDPACVSVCPVSAFIKTPEGPVIYDAKRCIGCRFCMVACPFGVPKYQWSKGLPLVVKCSGCYSRVKEGLIPACAKACPTAITYGSRQEMINEANRRLTAHPGKYMSRIYGLEEAGGTSVLYLSMLPFNELGFKKVTQRPLPSLTWAALRFVPAAFITMGGSLAFISWLTNRKERIRKEKELIEAEQATQKEDRP